MLKKILVLVLIAQSFSCKTKKENENKPTKSAAPQSVIVDIMIAKNEFISSQTEVNGSVLPYENVAIHPEISGRLTYLNVNDGAKVEKGTLLARINDADLIAQLNKSKIQLEMAQKTEERLRKLLAVNGINQADYDASLSQVNNLKADIEIAKAQLEKTFVKAPFSGVLGLRQISPGAYITPQTTLTTLLQNDKVKIDFTVPELYASQMQKGKNITILSSNNAKYSATILAVEPEINQATRNLKVRATLNQGNLIAGGFVKVVIQQSNNNQKSIIVPTSTIIPDAKSKKIIVLKNGKGIFTNVETGVRTASGVQIIQGLNEGDSVVVTGVLFVRPNSNLKLRSIKNAKDLIQ